MPRVVETPEEVAPSGAETVLLVEDEAILREIIEESLESLGYAVLTVANGAEAIELSARFGGRIDLMLTDVIMPGMGGSDLAGRLAEQRPETKVLFMSGFTDDSVLLHGVLAEGLPFLEKPFTAAALARKVREVLDRA
jgi:CheY-like chemotaxis protein